MNDLTLKLEKSLQIDFSENYNIDSFNRDFEKGITQLNLNSVKECEDNPNKTPYYINNNDNKIIDYIKNYDFYYSYERVFRTLSFERGFNQHQIGLIYKNNIDDLMNFLNEYCKRSKTIILYSIIKETIDSVEKYGVYFHDFEDNDNCKRVNIKENNDEAINILSFNTLHYSKYRRGHFEEFDITDNNNLLSIINNDKYCCIDRPEYRNGEKIEKDDVIGKNFKEIFKEIDNKYKEKYKDNKYKKENIIITLFDFKINKQTDEYWVGCYY